MSQTITAIYAEGVLRALMPLALPEQSEVEIEIKSRPPMTASCSLRKLKVSSPIIPTAIDDYEAIVV